MLEKDILGDNEVKIMTNQGLFTIEEILEKLDHLEKLEKLVYTDQLENTKHIENEYGRALTIFQNHCVVMEDSKYASKILFYLIKDYDRLDRDHHSMYLEGCELEAENEKLKKFIEIIKCMDISLNYDEEEINASIEINGYLEITKEKYFLLEEVLEIVK